MMAENDVIVTGASGQIGYFLLRRLRARDMRATALARRRPAWAGANDRTWQLTDLTAGWPGQLSGSVLIHAGPLSLLPGVLPRAADAGVGRVLAFSSTSVDVKADSADAAERAQAVELRRGEERLAKVCEGAGIAWTIFRPTLVYGAGLDRNLTVLADVIQRFGFVPLPGPGRGLRQPVHAGDLAIASIQALEQPKAGGRCYALGGATRLSYREMVERVFAALGRTPRIIHLPQALCRTTLSALRRLPYYRQLSPALIDRLERDQVVDHSPAVTDFGYVPRPFDPTPECFNPPGCH